MFPRDNSRYAEITWSFPSHPSSMNLFRVVLSGSQPCVSRNAFWFVRGENRTGMPSECKVQEEGFGNFRVCSLTCRCLVPDICGYLHQRVQFPSRVNKMLGFCYFELVYRGLIDPKLIIYWCVPSSTVNLQTSPLVIPLYKHMSHITHNISCFGFKFPACINTVRKLFAWYVSIRIYVNCE